MTGQEEGAPARQLRTPLSILAAHFQPINPALLWVTMPAFRPWGGRGVLGRGASGKDLVLKPCSGLAEASVGTPWSGSFLDSLAQDARASTEFLLQRPRGCADATARSRPVPTSSRKSLDTGPANAIPTRSLAIFRERNRMERQRKSSPRKPGRAGDEPRPTSWHNLRRRWLPQRGTQQRHARLLPGP